MARKHCCEACRNADDSSVAIMSDEGRHHAAKCLPVSPSLPALHMYVPTKTPDFGMSYSASPTRIVNDVGHLSQVQPV